MKKLENCILVVSRDERLAGRIVQGLESDHMQVIMADNGFDAIAMARKNRPGLLVFDSDLPKMNGIDSARIIKQDPKFADTAIFFLINEASDYTAISELKSLAEDCFLKPVNVQFLVRRINEVLSGNGSAASEERAETSIKYNGDLFIDRETYMVHYHGQELSFPKKEFELIYLLASSPEKVFTRKDIFRNVWNKDLNLRSARTIDVHIRKLREKLAGINIITVKGVGYKLSMK